MPIERLGDLYTFEPSINEGFNGKPQVQDIVKCEFLIMQIHFHNVQNTQERK